MNKRKILGNKINLIHSIFFFFAILMFTGCDSKVNISSKKLDGTTKEPQIETALEKANIKIPRFIIEHDEDKDGIKDLDDFLIGARKDVDNHPTYRSVYYNGGYPPENEGVCTDVIWRAFKEAGYNLKDMVDKDIRENISKYPRVNGKPDPNIDFRRVPNLVIYFKRYARVLTTEVIPKDVENLKEWQGGDIVVFDAPLEHIAVISDMRNEDGVPYMIHNGGPYTKEEDALLYWHENLSPITYHFRFPKESN